MARDIWLISDTHFGHKNIIKFVNKDGIPIRQRRETLPVPGEDPMKVRYRPFNSIEEHDAYLIERWNSVVKPQDHVWHGGDFGNFKAKRYLNGVINLIVGNHDEDFQHYVNGEEATIFRYSREYENPWFGKKYPGDIVPQNELDFYETKLIPLHPHGIKQTKKRVPGFKKIRESRLWGESEHGVPGLKFLQIHRPPNMLKGGDPHRKYRFVVHGHTHGHDVKFGGRDDPDFYNISVERLKDYTPVHIEEVAQILKKRM